MATTKRTPGIQERTNSDGSTSYRAQVRMRGFPHLSETFTRKKDAKAWIENTKTAIRGGTEVSTEAQRTTLKEALERYLREITPRKKGWKREQDRVKAWMGNPLSVRFLSQLRGAEFAKHRDERRAQGRAENTIAIELKLISKLYKIAARDWGMEGLRNPIATMTMPGPSRKRERRLSPSEETALLLCLERTTCGTRPFFESVPMHEAMRVTGHKTPSMLMRYYHPKAEDQARKLA